MPPIFDTLNQEFDAAQYSRIDRLSRGLRVFEPRRGFVGSGGPCFFAVHCVALTQTVGTECLHRERGFFHRARQTWGDSTLLFDTVLLVSLTKLLCLPTHLPPNRHRRFGH